MEPTQKTEQPTVTATLTLHDHILIGLRILARVCDGAHARDDVGFDGADASFGHRLAACDTLTPFELSWGKRACFKYHRQLGEAFIEKLTKLTLEEPPQTGRVELTPGCELAEMNEMDAKHPGWHNTVDPILTVPLDDLTALTDEQEHAVSTILDWVAANQDHYAEFKLGGYAGTGKTTVIRTIKAELQRRTHCVVCAFTGKAVNVLQRKGVASQTMHSLMYDVTEDKDGNISFSKKYSLKDDPDLVIVDEASMVSTDLYNDLKGFNVPVLFVGDPGQLEPVGENPNLMAKTNLVLSKIHRQAKKSPIIRLANDIRTGKISRVPYCNVEGLEVRQKVVRASEYFAADQIICAKNKTRQGLNTKIRIAKGFQSPLVPGEKLICLRNNRQRGVFNGMLLFVDSITAEAPTFWKCTLHDEVGRKFTEKVWKEPFLMPMVQDVRVPYDHIYCDYGYVITCHKSQGSEWDHVILLDEWMPPQVWDMKRWRYTGITRAAKRLTYCV